MDNRAGLYNAISDLHKDIYGYRCRDFRPYYEMSDERLEEEFKLLTEELEASIADEKAQEERTWLEFKAKVVKMADELGGHMLGTVVRWQIEAEEVHGDIDHFCYNIGLSEARVPTIKKWLNHENGDDE